jgi:hypothetical protein
MTRRRNLNPVRDRSSPRVVKRWRVTRYPARQTGHKTIRHNGPPATRLPSLPTPQLKSLISTS